MGTDFTKLPTASETYGENYPWKAFDNNTASAGEMWKALTLPAWIAWDSIVKKVVTSYTIKANNPATSSPHDFKLQGSNNNVDWTDIDTQADVTFSAGEQKTFNSFSNSTGYSRHRLYVTATGDGSGSAVEIMEIEFIASGADITGPPVTADSNQYGNEHLAINDNPVDFWCSGSNSSHWIKYDSGVGVSKVVNGYSIQARNPTYNYPKTFKLQGSTDDSEWVDLDTQTNLTFSDGEKKTFDVLGNTTAYRWHQLLITNTQSTNYAEIAEWELFEADPVNSAGIMQKIIFIG